MEQMFLFQPAFNGRINSSRRVRTYKTFKKQPGCYLIKENGVIVYVGMSKHCVVKACYRHFYKWTSWRRQRVTYFDRLDEKEYTILIIPLPMEQVCQMEQSLIITMNPRDNKERYQGVIDEILTTKGYVRADALAKLEKEESGIYGSTGDNDDLPF